MRYMYNVNDLLGYQLEIGFTRPICPAGLKWTMQMEADAFSLSFTIRVILRLLYGLLLVNIYVYGYKLGSELERYC